MQKAIEIAIKYKFKTTENPVQVELYKCRYSVTSDDIRKAEAIGIATVKDGHIFAPVNFEPKPKPFRPSPITAIVIEQVHNGIGDFKEIAENTGLRPETVALCLYRAFQAGVIKREKPRRNKGRMRYYV
jgi:hypothetical protein